MLIFVIFFFRFSGVLILYDKFDIFKDISKTWHRGRKVSTENDTKEQKHAYLESYSHPRRPRLRALPRNTQMGGDWKSVDRTEEMTACLDSYYWSLQADILWQHLQQRQLSLSLGRVKFVSNFSSYPLPPIISEFKSHPEGSRQLIIFLHDSYTEDAKRP